MSQIALFGDRITVAVVRPGMGLVTGSDVSGVVVRSGRSYSVETDAGDVLGTARTYLAGARLLAGHYGVSNPDVVVNHERDS